MTVLVTGARGDIGSRVVATLASRGHSVRASARDASTLAPPPGVDTVELDLAAPTNAEAALRDVRTVFLYATACMSGDLGDFLAAARDAGVRHMVMLSSPASFDPVEQDRVIGQVHRSAERAVEECGVPSTLLYPGWLASNAQRDWGAQIRERGRVGLPYPDANVAPVHLDDVAEVATDLLTREEFRGRMQVVTGPESMRLRDIVESLGEARGATVSVDTLTREQAMERREDWMPADVLDTLLEVEAAAVGVTALVTNTVERVTGHPARPFRTWANTHREDFVAR